MNESDHAYRCPLSAVDRRLEDVHRHWHEAERGYFDPESFRIAIQTAIQTLRTVTFILQSNKRIFKNFDPWYEFWQTRFRSDALMRWMVDARNKIEKQGDLETHSFVRAEIIASYYENGPIFEVPADLFQSSKELIGCISNDALMQHVLKDGILRVQRRWVENTLPDYELLEAVGIAYGKLAELVSDAHRELGLKLPATMVGEIDRTQGTESRGGRLPCMIGHDDARAQNVWLATGQTLEVSQKNVEFDESLTETAANRYGVVPNKMFSSKVSTPETTLIDLFTTARKMFVVDKYHETIAFLLHAQLTIKLMQLDLQEHGEKYLIMRMLANEVTRHGADGVIFLSETWSAVFDPSMPFRRAVDAPEKMEFLTGTLVTKIGDPVQLRALISRVGDNVVLGETEILRDQAHIAFAPIYAAWGRAIPDAWGSATDMAARDIVSESDGTE
jgi:hypothetical protein